MLNHLLLTATLLALLAALPFWAPAGFGTPPTGVWLLLAISALVMAFRGRGQHDL